MSPLDGVVATLTRQAAEHRELSRAHAVAHTNSAAVEEEAANRHAAATAAREAAERAVADAARALREAEESLAAAKQAEQDADHEHQLQAADRRSLAREAEVAADIAEALERLAVAHREQHTPRQATHTEPDPGPEPPAEPAHPDPDPLAAPPDLVRDGRRALAELIGARTGGFPVVRDEVIVATGGPTCTIPDAAARPSSDDITQEVEHG